MTSTQSSTLTDKAFSSSLFEALVKAIGTAAGSTWLVSAVPDAESASDESEPLRILLALDGSLQGTVVLEIDKTEASMLASKVMREPVEEFGDEHSAAILEVIQAGISDFSSSATEEFGEFTLEATLSTDPAEDRLNVVEMTASDDDSNRFSIRMYPDAALSQALSIYSKPNPEDSEPARSGSSSLEAIDSSVQEQVNLDLVMDVELNVTLRFGRRQLTLREVLELTTGSVVELDRQVEEPVELLLEGKVIARGEAVVIDGNYGLRVIEVPQLLAQTVRR